MIAYGLASTSLTEHDCNRPVQPEVFAILEPYRIGTLEGERSCCGAWERCVCVGGEAAEGCKDVWKNGTRGLGWAPPSVWVQGLGQSRRRVQVCAQCSEGSTLGHTAPSDATWYYKAPHAQITSRSRIARNTV